MGQQIHLLRIVTSLALLVIANTKYLPSTCIPPPAPAPFRNFIVYSAQGIYKPLEGPFPRGCSPDDPTVSGGVCTDVERIFYKSVMKFTEQEIKAEEAQAREFFMEKFGLDVEGLVGQGRVSFFTWFLDPRQEYTAFVFSGECVPREGYEVRDGGFMVSVIDPDGVELGGEFGGQRLPVGAAMVFGFYNIVVTGRYAREEVIRFKTLTPIIPSQGFVVADSQLEHPEWGEGLAQGLNSIQMRGDGEIQATVRNVLTFPPRGDP